MSKSRKSESNDSLLRSVVESITVFPGMTISGNGEVAVPEDAIWLDEKTFFEIVDAEHSFKRVKHSNAYKYDWRGGAMGFYLYKEPKRYCLTAAYAKAISLNLENKT